MALAKGRCSFTTLGSHALAKARFLTFTGQDEKNPFPCLKHRTTVWRVTVNISSLFLAVRF